MHEKRNSILHVTTGLNGGGAEAILYRLCSSDRSTPHYVVSLTSRGIYSDRLEGLGVEVSHLDLPRGRVTISAFRELVRIIRTIRPRAVQGWMYHGSLLGSVAARLGGVRNTFWGIRHSDVSSERLSKSTRIVLRVLVPLSKFLPQNIVYCAYSARASHESIGFAQDKGIVIRNGYDIEAMAPSAAKRERARQRLGISAGERVVGMVARWHPDKNHQLLLEALGLLRESGCEFRCVLVGSGIGSDNLSLVSLIEELGLTDSCVLVPFVEDVESIMNALDVHVLSSATEAFPNVIAEAMACGVPCVTTDVGDAREIVGDAGWVVPLQDPALMMQNISEALALVGTSSFQNMRERARKHIVSSYGLTRMTSLYTALWNASDEAD